MALTETDYQRAALRMRVHIAAIKAVATVESRGSGFCPDGFPKTLHEGHHFHRLTKGKFSTKHPTISYPKWTKVHYGKNWKEERARLDAASKLDRTAALMSNSWGAFQILGSNYAACGCKTLQEFVNRMCKSEAEQLELFIEYILFHRLDDELRESRFNDFARLYNGPGQVDVYGPRIAVAFKKFLA